VFAGLAILLTAVGMGGVVAYGVSRRLPELGLRIALGARAAEVRTIVLVHTARLALAGVALGVALSLVSTRVLAGFLFGVPPRDPLTLLGSSVLVVAVALAAGWLPAHRAARVDVVATLRAE
jgi:ABC-type antimicrobial peptide transport system permease subunit